MDHRKPIGLLFIVAEAIVLTGLYVAALARYNALGHYLLYYAKGLFVYIAVYVIILAVVTKAYDGYEMGTYRLREIAFSQILSVTLVNLIAYFQISLIAKQFLRIDYLIFTTVVQYIFILIWTNISGRIYHSVYKPGRTVLIYGGDYPDALAAKAEQSPYGFNLAAFVREGEAAARLELGDFDGFEGIMTCGASPEFGVYINQFCFARNMQLYIVPGISDVILHNTRQTGLSDTPLLVCRNEALTFGQEIIKRILDITGSIFILTVLSPFMAVTAAAIKLYDGGPVLYSQDRLTRDGKLFKVYKFRSMVDDAEKDGRARLAKKNDDRITPVGAFIRKIRFDEVPQFINVLIGDMSIVGPRPERPEIARQYSLEMPEFGYRLKMKAGITGYAQVYGKYNTTPRDKLLMDIIYINSYSILLDIELMLLTLKIIFLPDKTEGI